MVDRQAEKRSFIRVPFNTEVQVRAQGSTIRSQEGINISMSGMRLFTREVIPPAETPCHVAILLGGSDYPVIIEAQGKTVRSHEGSLAVKFLELDPDSYRHLRQLIVNNAQEMERAERELSEH